MSPTPVTPASAVTTTMSIKEEESCLTKEKHLVGPPSTTATPAIHHTISSPQASTTTQRSTLPHLSTCSAKELVDWLHQERFQGKTSLTNTFVQTMMQQAGLSNPTSDDATGVAQKEERASFFDTSAYQPLLKVPLETSMVTPRALGKVSMQLYQNKENSGLLLTSLKDASRQLWIPSSCLSHMILHAKPDDCKKYMDEPAVGDDATPLKASKIPTAHMVLLQVHPDQTTTVPFSSSNDDSTKISMSSSWWTSKQTKTMTQLAFGLSWEKGVGPTGPTLAEEVASGRSSWMTATHAWRRVFETCLNGSSSSSSEGVIVAQMALSTCSNVPFLSQDSPPGISTTTGGMPFVHCYHGVHDGVLFPMKEGLLFSKPPKFIPRSQLKSIACGRGGGGANASRYVDMVLELSNGETVEFTNIQRDELDVLNTYIHTVLIPAMKQDAIQAKTTSTDETEEEDEEGVVDAVVEAENDDENTEDDEEDADVISDQDDDEFQDGEESSDDDDGEEDESDNDDDAAPPMVKDDMMDELAKQKRKRKEGDETESEDGSGPSSRSRRSKRSG